MLIVAVVCGALLINGSLDIWFSYRENMDALVRVQRGQAEDAAAKVTQFVKDIEDQVGWTTQLPWSPGDLDQRRFDALRLLHQVPAITELSLLDPNGHEQLHVSRLAVDVIGSDRDLSKTPEFTEATGPRVYYGPVYFRHQSEPYMTLALAGTRRGNGVSVAEVNLKLIWDLVSQIKVGKRGDAYVIDTEGPAYCASGYQPCLAQHRHVWLRASPRGTPGSGKPRGRKRSRPGRQGSSGADHPHSLCSGHANGLDGLRRIADRRSVRTASRADHTIELCCCWAR